MGKRTYEYSNRKAEVEDLPGFDGVRVTFQPQGGAALKKLEFSYDDIELLSWVLNEEYDRAETEG